MTADGRSSMSASLLFTPAVRSTSPTAVLGLSLRGGSIPEKWRWFAGVLPLFAEAEGDEDKLIDLLKYQDVPLLRTIDPSIHPDLEAIVDRAVKRSVKDRLQTASLLADYLDRYLDHKEIEISSPAARRRSSAIGPAKIERWSAQSSPQWRP